MKILIAKLRDENAFLNDMLENAHNRSRLLEQQLAEAHRAGWEQAKAEAKLLSFSCACNKAIAGMEYQAPKCPYNG